MSQFGLPRQAYMLAQGSMLCVHSEFPPNGIPTAEGKTNDAEGDKMLGIANTSTQLLHFQR